MSSPSRSLCAVLFGVAVATTAPGSALGQGAIADSDLTVADVRYRSDTVQVKRVLGAPTSRLPHRWRYRGLTIHLEGARVEQIELATPRFATRRGLRVGDSEERITALYGEDTCMFGYYVFLLGGCDSDSKAGVGALVKNGRVVTIIVGRVMSMD